MRPGEKAFSVIELILVLALLGILFGLAVPPLWRASGDLRLRLAAGELVSALRSARWQAIRDATNVAVHFRPSLDGRDLRPP